MTCLSGDRARPGGWARARGTGLATLLGIALGVTGLAPVAVSANTPDNMTAEALASVPLPPLDLGFANAQYYVPATGHTVSGLTVDYWRATGGPSVYGNPISEPFAADNGLYSQAFERGILQFHLERTWTLEPAFSLMPIGQRKLDNRAGTFRADGKRAAGGGDRRAATWTAQDPAGETVAVALSEGGSFNEATGHTIAGDFQAWYASHEGPFYLGNPISQPLRERGELAQWFEGGLLMSIDGEVTLAPLPIEMAAELDIDTTPVAANGVPEFSEALFWNGSVTPPAAGIPEAGAKRIEVSLSQQHMWVYEGDTVVLETPVSTGLPPNETSSGNFRVRIKKPIEDMRGTTNEKGEVVWVAGEKGDPPRGSIPYGVEDVPNVLYFSLDAEALHGAYWHDNFGNRMSHGCVNLPLEVAEFLYTWAPLGTPVIVTE
jgi:lipoprotein-anchoring transpeptidase ErfK/SrfK